MLRAEEETLSKRCSPVLSNRDAVFDKRSCSSPSHFDDHFSLSWRLLRLLFSTLSTAVLPVFYCDNFSFCAHTHTQIPCHSSWDTFILFTFLFMQQLLSASPLRHVQMHSNTHSVIIFLFFFFFSSWQFHFFCSSPHQFHISANPKPNWYTRAQTTFTTSLAIGERRWYTANLEIRGDMWEKEKEKFALVCYHRITVCQLACLDWLNFYVSKCCQIGFIVVHTEKEEELSYWWQPWRPLSS